MVNLPTLYEYYQDGGIMSGLKENGKKFLLNEKDFTILSGTMHYYRVHPAYWRDRLRKIRAAGLNCVETYFAWNIHEPEEGFYEFGSSKTDFEEFCDIETFFNIAKEEDLFVIARPGPYICAEWEFGGLPSWLLRHDMKIRTSDPNYIKRVERYFGELLKIMTKFQFTTGGSIIAFQIENEYGNVKEEGKDIDLKHMDILKELFLKNKIVEFLFTSDTPSLGNFGSLHDILYTANFQREPEKELDLLKKYQPNRPCVVMEYWSGWFDHWGQNHETRCTQGFANVLERILKYPSSVNMYVFHGGTNWGFMNGGNFEDDKSDNSNITLDVTSYDYDAPLSENGDYGEKYSSVKQIIEQYSEIKVKIPDLPILQERIAYMTLPVKSEITLDNLLSKINAIDSEKLLTMEYLPINNNNGQSYGYINYRKSLDLAKGAILKIKDHVHDTVMILINGELISPVLKVKEDMDKFGFWKLKDSSLKIPKDYENATLDIIIENYGRPNFGKLYQFNQYKGLFEDQVLLNDTPLKSWKIFPLEFKRAWNETVNQESAKWNPVSNKSGPKLYKALLDVKELKDTYINMSGWTKGVVIVNGFVLGRYLKFGPQYALYLPAPLLKSGQNDITIFEHFECGKNVVFSKDPIFEKNS